METFSFRYDDQIKRELDYIKSNLNSSQGQAIKDAIHAFYKILKTQEEAKRPSQDLLKESGFIGCFEAKKNLSVTYKEDIAKGLNKKPGIE